MSADFTPEKEDYRVLSPFKMQVLTNFPYIEADFDALTNYQLLCKVVEYLNNVIANENEVTEQVTSLYNAYVALQNYVNTYFDNLDLTGEVSAKLDEMAEDGSLTNLIKEYVDPIYEAYQTSISNQVAQQNATITTFEGNVTSTLTEYNNKINGLFNYSPIPVTSTTYMTDTSKIYVNTSNGKWYYYDGDSWEIGGTYQSSANDDKLNNESTNAVQNKVITNAVSNVIDITNTSVENKSIVDITATAGYMDTSGNVGSTDTYEHTQKIAVKEGDVVTVLQFHKSSQVPNPIRFVCAFTDNTPVSASGSSSYSNSYTVPVDINYVVLSATIGEICGIIITSADEVVQTCKDNKLGDTTIANDIIKQTMTFTAGVMNEKGDITPSNDYGYSQKIEVNSGDVLYCFDNPTPSFRCLTAFRNDLVVTDYGAINISTYTVPFGINYVVLTVANGAFDTFFILRRNKNNYFIDKNLGSYFYKGEIDGEVKFDYSNITYDYGYSLSCNVTSIDKLSFGFTNSSNEFSPFIEIDDTKIYYKYGNEDRETAHGLTLANNLSIKIEDNPTVHGRILLSIYSNGELYTNGDTVMSMIVANGKPTIKIGDSVITNAVVGFSPKNINKDIWLFGDSWLSYDSARMPYYLIQNNNYKNVFINNFSGEGSVNGLTALTNLLKLNKPRYLLWLYGMNDSDDTKGVNNNWLSSLQDVIALCKANNIELILATIPSTSTQLMKHKNKIVKTSGYRYVDQEACLTNNGTWISGYQDGNHPTALGAKALYYRFISDVPELLNN